MAQLQNEWPLLGSLGETSSLDCKMNGHCLHLWERDRSITKWSLLAPLGSTEQVILIFVV
jgi:hypothetical protein